MSLVSMTGFGASSFEARGVRYSCTARSVNRRVLDLTLRIPAELVPCEPAIRATVQEVCGRGEVVVVIERERGATGLRVEVDEDAARALYEGYQRVAAAVGARPDVPLSAILAAPDVVRIGHGVAAGPGDGAAETIAGVRAAVDDMDGMRRREGSALQADIGQRLAAIRDAVARIRTEAPVANAALLERAAARARAVAQAAQVDVDPATLATAIAGLAERADISEEVARLDAHMAQFDALLGSAPPHGRRLDFMCQEVLREVSTVSAKAQSTPVSHLVVEVKADVERVREQAANVL